MFNRLSITTRFVAIILCLSIFLILLYSSLGFVTARDSLRNSIDEHLVSIREAKAHELKSLMKRIRTQVLNLAISSIGQEAARDFITGFADTQDRQLSANEDQLLSNFYNKEFLPALAKSLDAAPNPSTYIPQDAQIKYLQYHYIANNPLQYEKKGGLVQAPEDKSGYAAAHQRWHPQLERFARTNEYEDLLVVDAASDQVVYSVNKTVEFATNLRDGPYAESNLGRLYKLVRRSADRDDYQMIDFDRYRPIMNRPAAFIASPVFQADHMIAVLIFRFPVEIATNILTGDRNWKSQGLGSTGETLLIADDRTLRSRSRFMLEDKDAFMNVLKQLGTPTRILDRIEKDGMLIFNLHDRSEAVTQAMLGETGIMACTDYRNQSVLAAYAPIEVENRRWAIVSKMDQDEAFAPIYDFGRQALALAAGSIIVLTLVAMMVARYFLRPIQQLSAAARQVSRGNYDVEVHASSGYEFRDLADAFNEMTRSLMQKNQQIARKMEENEKLLLNILPAPVAARLKEGGELTDSFSDVTVLFAEIRGFDDLAEVIPAGQAVKLLNELIVSFDEASERHGVEKVKTVGTSFMAVCGLSVQRPDHVNRIVEFALELKRIITAFNQLRNTNLHLVIGIHAGPVVGGVVGKDKFIYELWGNTVNVAQALRSSERLDTIQVTDAVRERLGDLHRFIQLGEIELPNRTHIAVWLIES